MAVGTLFAVSLLIAAVLLAARPLPGGWSDELRAVVVIELVVGAVLVLDAAVIYRLSRGRRRMSWKRNALIVLALALAVAAAIFAGVLPFGLPECTRWLIVAGAAVALAAATTLFVYSLLPPKIQKKARTWRGAFAVVIVLAAAAAVVSAVLVPGIPGWGRWGLAFVAVALMLLGRLWKQAAWPDVAAAALIAIFVTAGIAEVVTKPEGDDPPPPVAFDLPAGMVTILEPVAKEGKAVVIVVKQAEAADDEAVSSSATSYLAKAPSALTAGEPSGAVSMEIERGEANASATAFAADLADATQIYVMKRNE